MKREAKDPDDFADFTWYWLEAGYKWIDARVYYASSSQWGKKVQRVLTDGRMVFEPLEGVIRYQPLKSHPELFRTFAEIIPSEEGIIGFANKHGMLGIGKQLSTEPEGQKPGTRFVAGEPIAEWKHHIGLMKGVIELWERTIRKDAKWLGQRVQWHGSRPGKFVTFTDEELGRGYRFEPGDFEEGDIFTPARIVVQRIINSETEGTTSVQLRYCREKEESVSRIIPRHLLGALWYQLHNAVNGGKKYRACKVCQKIMEISQDQGGFRVNRELCSDACKSQDYRNKKSAARAMHAEGKTIKQIAKQLDVSKESTVKGWLKKGRS